MHAVIVALNIVLGIQLLLALLPLLIVPVAADSVSIKTFVAQGTVWVLLLGWAWGYRRRLRVGELQVEQTLDAQPSSALRSRYSPLSLALLAFLLVGMLSFLVSDYRYASFEELTRYATYVGLVFLVRHHIRTQRQVAQLLTALSIGTAIVCAYGLAQRLGYDFAQWDIDTGRILSSFGHPNFFAGYLVIVIPVLMMSFLVVTSRIARVLLGATLVMAMLCLLFTYSRGAFLGIIPALGVLTGMLWLYLRREERRHYRRQLVLLTLLVLIPLALTLALDERLLERASSATKLETDVTVSNQARLVIWQGAWEMFQAKPLFGWGLGTFAIHFPQFRPSDYSRRGVSHNTQHAHCEYLEVAAELGVVGLVGFLLILVLAFYQVHRALRTQESVRFRLLLIGCTCGILASLLHNLVSVNLRWTEPAFTFWFVLGLMTRMGSVEKPVPAHPRVCPPPLRSHAGTPARNAVLHVLLVTTALLLSGIILASFVSDIYTGIAQRHLKLGHKLQATESARKACLWNPYNAEAYYALAYTYSRQGYLEDAVRVYHRLQELAPDYAQVHLNLASTYSAMQKHPDATAQARKAVALDDSATTHALLGDILMRQEAWQDAQLAFQRAIELDDGFGYAHQRLKQLAEREP